MFDVRCARPPMEPWKTDPMDRPLAEKMARLLDDEYPDCGPHTVVPHQQKELS
jgi:hypothetical protein